DGLGLFSRPDESSVIESNGPRSPSCLPVSSTGTAVAWHGRAVKPGTGLQMKSACQLKPSSFRLPVKNPDTVFTGWADGCARLESGCSIGLSGYSRGIGEADG